MRRPSLNHFLGYIPLRSAILRRVNHRFCSTKVDINKLLSKPTWSMKSLLASHNSHGQAPKVTPEQLYHLLRLSALPAPQSEEEEQNMKDTLTSQLHFVKQIQQVQTQGVNTLPALRDETTRAQEEATVTLETVGDAIAQEVIVGKHHIRVQRKDAGNQNTHDEDWNATGYAEHTASKYFIVNTEKP